MGPEILGRCSGNLDNVVDLTETMILRQKSAENPNIPPFSLLNHAARSKIEFQSTERRESRILPLQDHKFFTFLFYFNTIGHSKTNQTFSERQQPASSALTTFPSHFCPIFRSSFGFRSINRFITL